MQVELPVTIHRSFVGYVTRIFSGVFAVAALFGALTIALHVGGPLPSIMVPVVLLYLIAVAVTTVVSIYVYGLSYVQLTETGVTVQRWDTLFADTQAEITWQNIQSAESNQNGFFQQVLGYGTLTVLQNASQQPITLTNVQDCDHWASYINTQAQAHPDLVHNV